VSRLLLALDTATRTPVLALAGMDGGVLAERRWESRHRHGEQLLEELSALLAQVERTPRDIDGVAVGVGPGSFTGLRIGLATAKVLAHSLNAPLIGVSTTRALALAAGERGETGEVAVTLPAGVADRYVHRFSVADGMANELRPPALIATADAFAEAVSSARVVAVDLKADDVDDEARSRGRRAVEGLATALAREGAAALAAGRNDDSATLVPAYVALPRGIAQAAEEMQWSPDLR
jgi:tRNA threonylcarbamoyladenosine biosynthesis protein TsaB